MTRAHFAKLWSPAVALAVAGALNATGCTSGTETVTTTTTSPAVVSPGDRVVMATNGRWELRGDGRATPYYWVWIPAGSTVVTHPAAPPPLPR
jgi:hypothetical protein